MRVALLLAVVVVTGAPAQAQIEGAWRPEHYVLKDGAEHEVSGLIFFTDRDWTVLFFVRDGEGTVRRGSGEGGTYELEGDRLTFTHRFHLSAGEALGNLAEAPLAMRVQEGADAATEPCRVEVDGSAMTIYFPSGNRMEFVKSSGF